jgi:amino acid transporter, AAT family
MVGVGGSIGTGILLGSGAAMQIAGPAAILSFIAAAFICFTVTMALGELACAHPAAGSFGVYGELYLNPFAGFLARAGYWIGMALNIGAEMVAAATYMAYWFPAVQAYVWVLLFAGALLLVNLSSVGSYGRFEFWLSIIKLATIAGFIVIGAGLLLGGRVHPQYNASGGFLPNGPLSPLVALTFALYSFGGVEMVAVATGEARSSKDTPRAVWLTFVILVFVYLGAIVVLLGVMPWNHAGVNESPFVTVFRTVKIPRASSLMNFVALSAALSGANAALYVASRMVFSLARTGWAPANFGRLNRSGSPQSAVLISAFGVVIAAALALWFPENAFRYLVGAGFTGMICSWLVSLAAHVSFRRRRSAVELANLPLRSPLGGWGSPVGLVLVSLALLETWLHPRVNLFSGLASVGILSVAYLFIRRVRKDSWSDGSGVDR